MSQKPAPKPKVLDIHPYVPGESGNGEGRVIKLASNESPLGPSPKAKEAVIKAAGALERYPDGASTLLRHEIANAYGLDPVHIVCGNGSEQLIAALALIYAGHGEEVIQSQYGFLVYRIATLAAGAELLSVPEMDYTTDVDALLAAVSDRTRIIFLANPNNPTGTYIAADEVERLWRGLPSQVLLVLDTAYAEYVEAEDYSGGFALVDRAIEEGSHNVCVLRTFSKIYGLAAIRLGWCYGPSEVIDTLNRVRGAFNISALAQAAGIAAVGDQAHIKKARAHNHTELARLTTELEELGLRVLPSAANFVCAQFSHGVHQAREAFTELKKHGIILRPVEGYGLAEFLRITVGLQKENDALLAALKNYLK